MIGVITDLYLNLIFIYSLIDIKGGIYVYNWFIGAFIGLKSVC